MVITAIFIQQDKRRLQVQNKEEAKSSLFHGDLLVTLIKEPHQTDVSNMPIENEKMLSDIEDCSSHAVVRGKHVYLRVFYNAVQLTSGTDMLDRLGELKSLFHQNITQFIGLYPGTEKTIIMMSFAEKGSLKDLIADETIKFTWEMKMSLISDVGRGLGYLHKVDMPWPLEEFKLCSEQSVGLQDY